MAKQFTSEDLNAKFPDLRPELVTIIAGSRGITYMPLLEEAVRNAPFRISKIYCGMARGADTLGWQLGAHLGIPTSFFPAKWDEAKNEYERRVAGIKRNQEMIDKGAEALIALWDGHSTGTKDMIERAKKAGLYTYVMTAMQIWVPMKEEIWTPKTGETT